MTGCIYYRAGHCVSPNRCQYKVKGKLGPECAKAGELGEVEKSSEVRSSIHRLGGGLLSPLIVRRLGAYLGGPV